MYGYVKFWKSILAAKLGVMILFYTIFYIAYREPYEEQHAIGSLLLDKHHKKTIPAYSSSYSQSHTRRK